MNIKVLAKKIDAIEDEVVVLSLLQDSEPRYELLKELDNVLDGQISNLVRLGDFRGRFLETHIVYPVKSISPRRILLIGLGPEKELSLDRLRQASAVAAKKIMQLGLNGFTTMLHGITFLDFNPRSIARVIVEGAVLAGHSLDRFRTLKKQTHGDFSRIHFVTRTSNNINSILEGAKEGSIYAMAANFARDIITTPGNYMNTENMEAVALSLQEIAHEENVGDAFRVKSLHLEELRDLHCGGILGVGQGSIHEPRMIVMEYWGAEQRERPLVLIGKGITFDSGGLSLKEASSMEHGKYDKTGAAAVISIMRAILRLRHSMNVIGIVPLAENMPGGSAMRPGDILTMASGMTVEVVSTDAEGRLLLADALDYSLKYNPFAIVDLATLTGTAEKTFGQEAIGILGNSARLMALLISAGERSKERVWPLPLWDAYDEKNLSDIADLKNEGGKSAGTIIAAKFLQRFVDSFPWVHLDVCGPAWLYEESKYLMKGPSGVGVRIILTFLETLKSLKAAGHSLEELIILTSADLGEANLPGVTEKRGHVSLMSLAIELNYLTEISKSFLYRAS